MLPEAPSGLIPSEIEAERVFDCALTQCARGPITRGGILQRLQDGDPELHSRFRYALAKELSAYLGQLNAGFQGVYLYGSAMGESASRYSDIDVIVVVTARNDRTAALLALLDLSLVSQYRDLVGTRTLPQSLLDVRVIDETELAERDGYGAVLDGLFTRPVCLWRSTPRSTGALHTEGPRQSSLR